MFSRAISNGLPLAVAGAPMRSACGYLTSSNPPRIAGGPSLGGGAHAHMAHGGFNGALVPNVVRTGHANSYPFLLAVHVEATSTVESTFGLTYPSSNRNRLHAQGSQDNPDFAIATAFSPASMTGGRYAILLQALGNGGVTLSSAAIGHTAGSTHHFGIGAFVGPR